MYIQKKMVHEVYDVNATGHFFVQFGQGQDDFEGRYRALRWQRGSGFNQTGRGVLTSLGRMWRFLIPAAKKFIAPLAKKALSALGEEGLEAGAKVLSNISQGANPKDAIMSEGTQAFKKLAKRAGKSLTEVGEQSGGRRRRKRKNTISNLRMVGRSVLESAAKQKRAQNLGLY